jgi:hypothetical protein
MRIIAISHHPFLKIKEEEEEEEEDLSIVKLTDKL